MLPAEPLLEGELPFAIKGRGTKSPVACLELLPLPPQSPRAHIPSSVGWHHSGVLSLGLPVLILPPLEET